MTITSSSFFALMLCNLGSALLLHWRHFSSPRFVKRRCSKTSSEIECFARI